MSAQPNALADPYAAYGGQAIPAQSASDPYAAYGGKVASAGVDLSNQQGQGTYQMRNQQGQTVGVPYGQVQQAAHQGYDCTDDQNRWHYSKDNTADHQRARGTTFSSGMSPEESTARADNIERNASLPMQIIGGIAKGGGTIARPVLDAGAYLINAPSGTVDQMLTPKTTAQSLAKYGTIGAAIAPAAIAAPFTAARALIGGGLGSGVGNLIGQVSGANPNTTALLEDAGGFGGGLA